MFKSLSALLGSQVVLNSTIEAPKNQTLREAAEKTGVYIGTAMSYGHLKNDTQYGEIAAQEYNLITAENSCKMMQIAKSYDELDFDECKSVVETAQNNK